MSGAETKAGEAIAIGIDVGTSGARVAALDRQGALVDSVAERYPGGADRADPTSWWQAVSTCLDRLAAAMPLASIEALAVDGTSGTMLGLHADGRPAARPLLYDEPCPDEAIIAAVNAAAPAESPARGSSSALARAIFLSRQDGVVRLAHQADWIAAQITGAAPMSDANNALKTGYDPLHEKWPDWIASAGLEVARLPKVVLPGRPAAQLGAAAAKRFGLPVGAILAGGTTDGCASFLATGADRPGDAVTALGSTLVLKLLSDRPVNAPQFGIYSHRIGDMWLAGGASNAGGAVLAAFFDADQIAALTPQLMPETPTGLDYYPLNRPGERFPIADPNLEPRLSPRPEEDARFLQGLLEGIASVEALGYRRLAEIGAPRLASVRAVGGGAKNPGFTRIRERALGVPFLPAVSTEAAVGAARLALKAIGAA
ncbi:FGGY-family carbohydrate kinase [Jiella sp. MQZ9-1]|uniref:FGGY-family carbohydrate kinase n=1 Tax=Jiella flava TaxID=2816857 RepID=A0A939FUA8_9HYPH|nr:FGGY-family carbohydrate kinase [Jiella flava]MBO0662078.1 FGGY-family carbohydrate kinase [Jiella flava]MCD2470594.1 FGGY-family carbohydrate kinase [Jiella flava]